MRSVRIIITTYPLALDLFEPQILAKLMIQSVPYPIRYLFTPNDGRFAGHYGIYITSFVEMNNYDTIILLELLPWSPVYNQFN